MSRHLDHRQASAVSECSGGPISRGHGVPFYLAATRRIHGLALWMPPDCDFVARQRARDAAFAISRLTGRGVDVPVAPRDDEARPLATHPDRWLRRSRGWVTAFPAIHERLRTLDLGGSRALVPSRRSVGAGGLSVGAHAAGPRGARPGARGSEPVRQTCPALLACRAPVRASRSGTGRDRFRTTARLRALRTGRLK